MPSVARRIPLQSELSPAPQGVMELEPPETVAEPPALQPPEAPPAKAQAAESRRRGPLRPGQLLSARARMDGSGPVRAFRLADAVVTLCLAAAVCSLAEPSGLLHASLSSILPVGLAAGALIWWLDGAGAYRFSAREMLPGHLVRLASAIIPAAALMAATSLLLRAPIRGAGFDVLWLGLETAALAALHTGWWALVRRWRTSGRLTPNVVVVGATRNAELLIRGLMQSREANVLGVFDDRLSRAPRDIHGVPVLGDTQALVSHRVMPFVDRIVVTVPTTAQGRVREIIERLHVLPNPIALFLDFQADEAAASQALARLAGWPLAQVSGVLRDERRAFWKRVQDLSFGTLGLIAALPVMGLIALAIRLDSPGPVFFRQRRHGFNNEEIVVWKFRSMRHEQADATAARQISADDDRVTRVGRFIRSTSLDEVPQIFNVLKGEMSLVGPRPHAIGMKTGDVESARLVAEYAHRHRLKPGMTGWAAIKGSRGPVDTPESVRRRVELDVAYIERQSFWLDLYIMAVTVPCLLGDRSTVR